MKFNKGSRERLCLECFLMKRLPHSVNRIAGPLQVMDRLQDKGNDVRGRHSALMRRLWSSWRPVSIFCSHLFEESSQSKNELNSKVVCAVILNIYHPTGVISFISPPPAAITWPMFFTFLIHWINSYSQSKQ